MTKQDLIKDAYGNASIWEKLKSNINDDGWCTNEAISTDIDLLDILDLDNIDREVKSDMQGNLIFRPTTLKGIETNNGWELIEDLNIDEDEYVLFLRMKEGGEVPIYTCISGTDFEIGYFTHWKKIDISKFPLFDSI